MKVFIATLVLFALIVGLIIVNNIYINKTADRLTEMVESLPAVDNPECTAALAELDGYWKKHKNLISLSVAYLELNQVDSLTISLTSYAKSNADTEFEITKAVLLCAVNEMRRLEKLSVFNIF